MVASTGEENRQKRTRIARRETRGNRMGEARHPRTETGTQRVIMRALV
ncbi:hypothetical protein [Nitrosomonas communis]